MIELKDALVYMDKAGGTESQMAALATAIARSNWGDVKALLEEVDANLPKQLEELRAVKDTPAPPPATSPAAETTDPYAGMTLSEVVNHPAIPEAYKRSRLDSAWGVVNTDRAAARFKKNTGIDFADAPAAVDQARAEVEAATLETQSIREAYRAGRKTAAELRVAAQRLADAINRADSMGRS